MRHEQMIGRLVGARELGERRVAQRLPGFADTEAHLSEVADRVEREHDRILVTRNGRPSFVLVSPDELASLEESLDILQDDELLPSAGHPAAERRR